MARILIINPNSSEPCGAGIDAAIDPLRSAGKLAFDVVSLPEGPPAIYSWRDWHSVVEPICRCIEREPADAYVIACASDPGLEAARAATARPVLGIFRSAVAIATARAERFGVIAIAESSKARHLAALRAMGLDRRLAIETALNMSMEALLDPLEARDALLAASKACVRAGAEVIILGCTGMAGYRAVLEEVTCVPIIEPSYAAASLALMIVLESKGELR